MNTIKARVTCTKEGKPYFFAITEHDIHVAVRHNEKQVERNQIIELIQKQHSTYKQYFDY